MKRARPVVQLVLAFALGWFLSRWFSEDALPAAPAPGSRTSNSTSTAAADPRAAQAPSPAQPFERTIEGAVRPTSVNAPPAANVRTDEPPLPRCRPRLGIATADAKSRRDGARVTLELVNDCDEPVTSAWVDFDGAERANPGILLSRSSSTFTTYVGHVFRLRLGDAQRSLLREVTVPPFERAQLHVCGCGPDEVSSAIPPGFEALDAGVREKPLVPSCAVPFNTEPGATTASATRSERFSLVFRNTCASTRIALDWVQFDGGLRSTGTLEPGATLDQSSFAGHQWRLRDANTGRWIRDFVLDGGAQVDLCECP